MVVKMKTTLSFSISIIMAAPKKKRSASIVRRRQSVRQKEQNIQQQKISLLNYSYCLYCDHWRKVQTCSRSDCLQRYDLGILERTVK